MKYKFKEPKTILVSGCAGFIGSNFIKQFKKEFSKTKIIGIDDFSTGRKDALETSVIFYEGSILDDNLLEKIFSKHKPEYVFHFAADCRLFAPGRSGNKGCDPVQSGQGDLSGAGVRRPEECRGHPLGGHD